MPGYTIPTYKAKPIKHISPSALLKYESQPASFFLERCIEPSRPRSEAGPPAWIGTMFDILVKSNVANMLGRLDKLKAKLGCPADAKLTQYLMDSNLPELKPEGTGFHLKDTVVHKGFMIYEYYKRVALENTNLSIDGDLVFNEIELQAQKLLDGRVPTFCKGDFSLTNGESVYPADWKVMGANSKVSPKPLYGVIFDSDGNRKPAHKNWHPHIHMKDINPDWATQLVFTGWQCGAPIDVSKMYNYRGIIHALVCDSSDPLNFKVRLAIYEGIIDAKWQESVLQRAINMWDSISSGAFYREWRNVDLTSMIANSETWY